MIERDLSWIERRKETVVILDDTALRRQISVDFTLRGTVEPLLEDGGSGLGDLYCAPLYILPKSPSSLMAFDLEDEEKRSLWLISREDNAKISGAALASMARRVLPAGPPLPAALEARTDSLRTWLIVLAVVAGFLLVGLIVTYLRGKVSFKRHPKTRFRVSHCYTVPPWR
jgi:hypothetical protein